MQTKGSVRRDALRLRVGDVVEVLSDVEILATLDENGELDCLPFMPEMLAYCGRRFRVGKVAHKLCDTIDSSGMRRMARAVHLTDVRCDGAAHGGCQAACLIYWKEAWLRKVDPADAPGYAGSPPTASSPARPVADLQLLQMRTRKEPGPDGAEVFSCQSTEILRAAPTCVPLRDVRQIATDVRSGNASLASGIRAWLVGLFNAMQNLSKRLLPKRLWFRQGLPWGFLRGEAIPPTPNDRLDLQAGELVRIKSKEEILRTLDQNLRNRGLGFDAEAARSCGQEARVIGRVKRLIDERTGRMLELKNPCILLDGQVCEGVYNMSCPRGHYTYYREVWLERLGDSQG